MKTGSIMGDFMYLVKAIFVLELSALNLVLGILDTVWHRPFGTLMVSLAFLATRTLV